MSWNAIVVGVDRSREAAVAAALGEHLARLASVDCRLAHALTDEWASLAAVGGHAEAEERRRLQAAIARQGLHDALSEVVSRPALDRLEIRFGRAPVVVQRVAEEHDAGLIVVGGKHHTVWDRWLSGSTNHGIVRTSDRPVLVTSRPLTGFRRILAAADLSAAAGPTLAVATRFARLTGATLRVVSVFEPLPAVAAAPRNESDGYYELSQEVLERDIWPLIPERDIERLVRHGGVVETLQREAAEWGADLLVLGSHGKGWAQRVLLGSVTERLLNDLPTALLIAPVAGRAALASPAAVQAGRHEQHEACPL